jgi:hypothetical protein
LQFVQEDAQLLVEQIRARAKLALRRHLLPPHRLFRQLKGVPPARVIPTWKNVMQSLR